MKTNMWQWLAVVLSGLALAFVVAVAVLFFIYLSTGWMTAAILPLGWTALGLGALGASVVIGGFVKERRG